ncbi:flavin-containing monooxygenase [Nigerium massiliense]|uniref:flavin-containing monooxygenase n=1 Tax=Nigerium massiliense TaxID=1522317 RepID=UPI00058BA5E6|nr:NAD(P)-binding domain-containing protein [Nigerium massiliense]
MSSSRSTDVAVIGAGQAGLSAGYHLLRRGFRPADERSAAAVAAGASERWAVAGAGERSFVMVDGEPAPGGAWRHRWPSLTMATVNNIADLPGMEQPEIAAATPSRQAVPAYFAAFEERFGLPVERPVRVRSVSDDDGRLLIEASDPAGVPLAPIAARALINATGTWRHPFVPYVPGASTFAGRQLRTVDYCRAEEFRGQRVGVVGGGISATGFLAELSALAETFWYTRREPWFREGPFDEQAGREVVAAVAERTERGLPPLSVVSQTGLIWTPALRAADARGALDRRPMFVRIEPAGVVEADGSFTELDALIWATGFRADLDHLAPLHLRGPGGGGIRLDGSQVADDPRVHLIGYGPSASTIGANRAGRDAVRRIEALLAARPARS